MTTSKSPKSIKSRLRSALIAAATICASVVTVTTGPAAPAHAAEGGCTVDCVTTWGISVNAQSMSVYTTVPTLMKVEFFEDPHRSRPAGVAFSYPNVTIAHTLPIKKWSSDPILSGPPPITLAPATRYYIVITAQDAAGNVYVENVAQTTYQRRLTVTVNELYVADDGDLFGAGEMTFHMRTGTRPAQSLLTKRSVTAPARFPSLGTKVYDDMPASFSLQFRGQDDDCEFSSCQAPSGDWASGDNSDVSWNTATTATIVPSYVGQSVGTFTAQAHGPVYVIFTVSGTWKYEWIPAA